MPTRFLLPIIAIATGLAVAEALARHLIRRGRPYMFPPNRRQRLYLDRETHPQLEPVIHHLANALGERGRAVPRGGRIYRVLVVGGSAAECYLLDQETQWPAVLEARLRVPASLRVLHADDAHVGNLGRSGMDSGSLGVLLATLLPYYPRLDLIVVNVGANDVVRWLEAGAPIDRPAAVMRPEVMFASRPDMSFGLKPRQWGLTEWMRRLRLRSWETQRNAVRWMGRARRDRANASVVRHEAPGAEVVVDSFREQFRQVLHQCKGHADRVFVLRQAWFGKECYTPEEDALLWSGSVGQAYRGTVSEFYSSKVICDLMERVDAAAGEIAHEEHVEELRLQDVLSISAEHFIDHWHATPAGSLAIGNTLADAILAGRATPSTGV